MKFRQLALPMFANSASHPIVFCHLACFLNVAQILRGAQFIRDFKMLELEILTLLIGGFLPTSFPPPRLTTHGGFRRQPFSLHISQLHISNSRVYNYLISHCSHPNQSIFIFASPNSDTQPQDLQFQDPIRVLRHGCGF